ncbi:alpha/beta hydrolase [Nocardioides sp. InS609-2]|uniref:alpha/beta fold hydrolase n=1 Tax=Nocardioides sp. InS609-2 TaxID=2760705 RepID=UPI0020BF2C55|nr:alpha/beta hydrolase [Nocardioides sp. InS609-2]
MAPASSSFPSDVDGIDIATYSWPDTSDQPRGVVQIAHGLAEHGARYDRLAQALNAAGFVVGATDHRGHGSTGGDHLGDFGEAGFGGLIADVAEYGVRLGAEHAELPLFLVAHSMGSFAAQSVLLDHSAQYAGVVLSGSTTLDVLATNLSQSEEPAGLEAFNAGFEHRTGYEWLSRDTDEVDAYVADPWCGFDLPEATVPSLFDQAARLADPLELARVRDDLPMLITSGSNDPLAGGGQLVELLGHRYRDAGLTDVTVRLYDDARHEIFNETNRDEVTADVVAWLHGHC